MLCGMGASSTALAITAEDKAELERIVRSGRTEQRHALRARIILGASEGRSNNALAKELKTSRPTIVDWRARYVEGGVKALFEDRPRGRSFEAVARSKEAEIVAKTQSPPANATHWSCRRMAETCGVSTATTTLRTTTPIPSPLSGLSPPMTSPSGSIAEAQPWAGPGPNIQPKSGS